MRWFEKYATKNTTPSPGRGVPAGVTSALAGDPQAARYAEGALRRACDAIATAPKGTRNDTLNSEAFSIGQLVKDGHLDEQHALQEMWLAARDCGLGDKEIQNTIPRAIGDAEPRNLTLDPSDTLSVPDVSTFTPSEEHPPDGHADAEGDAPGEDAEGYFARRVAQEKIAIAAREAAKRELDAERAGTTIERIPPPVAGDTFLAVEDPPIQWLLQGLQPCGTNALLVAQAKSGKTTMVTNLVKALVDKLTFLGEVLNSFEGTVTLIDDELDERMLRRWLRNVGLTNPGRLRVVTLRGRLSTFNIVDPDVRAAWAANLAGTDYLILDCLRPAMDACGLDENHDAGIFLNAYGDLLHEAGIPSSLVVHHMGHTSQRSRGDSRIMDWPDVLWKLTRADPEDPKSTRSFEAFGREVDFARRELEYDNGTLTLSETDSAEHFYAYPEPTNPMEWMIVTWLQFGGEAPRSKRWWKDQAANPANTYSSNPGGNEAERLVDQLVANGTFLALGDERKTYTPAPTSLDVKRLNRH